MYGFLSLNSTPLKLPILLNLKFWRVPIRNQEAKDIAFIQTLQAKLRQSSSMWLLPFAVFTTAPDSAAMDYMGGGHTFIKQ